MAAMEAQGENMKTEYSQYLKNPLYWIIIGLGLAFRTVLAYFDCLYREPQFWELAADFWNKTGSVTAGLLVLLVVVHRFSYDVETGVFSIINSTAYGRLSLFWNRLIGGGLAAALSVLLLYVGNLGISLLLGYRIDIPYGWICSFTYSTAITLVGVTGFFTVSAMVCDLTKNHPISICLCGLLFANSYFINAGAVKPPDIFWFLRYGFFTELVRGRAITSLPAFWLIWYLALISLMLFLTIKKRRGNKEL